MFRDTDAACIASAAEDIRLVIGEHTGDTAGGIGLIGSSDVCDGLRMEFSCRTS